MEDIIRMLPDSIANQIAAGEVVQRPASVVKELMENSVDAGASHIKLVIKDAGKALIQVIDDGKGMSATDARMSFERHATSKISKAEDLFSIRTMGFRGEALASIAAVAQVELKTKRATDELGSHLVIEGSEVKMQEPASTQKGTIISVKNLFYNVPARRNFLKTNPVELRHITEEFQRIALAYPAIRFSMFQNDQETYLLDDGKLSRRIVQLLGKSYQEQLIPCEEETPYVKIKGYVGKPDQARKTRGEQFFFINNRYIKNGYLHHAIMHAYNGMIQEDSHPFYVIFIDIDPKHVDINVHPTKTEVKFDDDRLLYGVIAAATRQALGAYNVSPSLDFSADVNFDHFVSKTSTEKITSSDRSYMNFKNLDQRQDGAKNWEQLFQNANIEDFRYRELAKLERSDVEIKTIESQTLSWLELKTSEKKNTLQIHGKYLIRQVKSGIVIINQAAAHERILYENYLSRCKNQNGVSQSILFPQHIELNPSDINLVIAMQPELRNLGFEVDLLGKNSIVINGAPPEITNLPEKEIFEGLLEQFKQNKERLELNQTENLARSLARRSSIKEGQLLKQEEIDHLIDQLFACAQPNFTPDGQPIFVVLSLDKLASLF
jgi:DNA mismatch repair protein MutL